MIVHIVFFKLKNYPEGLKELQENIMLLKGKINEIRDFYIGEDISRADRSYDLALYSTFDTKKDRVRIFDGYLNLEEGWTFEPRKDDSNTL